MFLKYYYKVINMSSWSKTIEDIYKLIGRRRLSIVEIPLESDLAKNPKMEINRRIPVVEIFYNLNDRPNIGEIVEICRSRYLNQGILAWYEARTTVESFFECQRTLPEKVKYKCGVIEEIGEHEYVKDGTKFEFEVSILSPVDPISEIIKKMERNKEESLEELQECAHYRIESTINNKKIGDMAPFIQLFRFRFKKR
jgi:CBS domain-containing protein